MQLEVIISAPPEPEARTRVRLICRQGEAFASIVAEEWFASRTIAEARADALRQCLHNPGFDVPAGA